MGYCRVLGSLSYNDFASYLGNLSLSQKVPYLFFQLLYLLPLPFFHVGLWCASNYFSCMEWYGVRFNLFPEWMSSFDNNTFWQWFSCWDGSISWFIKVLAPCLTVLVSAAPLVWWASVVSEPQLPETSSKSWNLTAQVFHCYHVLAKITWLFYSIVFFADLIPTTIEGLHGIPAAWPIFHWVFPSVLLPTTDIRLNIFLIFPLVLSIFTNIHCSRYIGI